MEEKKEITIKCDECGAEFGKDDIEPRARVIASDEDGYDVTEKYFSCPMCGQHYTITVIDREMLLMIQRRKQIRRKIKMHIKRRSSPQAIRTLQEQDDALKDDLMHKSKYMKEKYREYVEG